ncbi:MAG: hypothetical protein RL757_3341 [Bacteroidota bacterium]|jgi:UDP-N-acetylmuramoyl-L-alanyl-D-glutamate--2,6-diaminopimelate ligase
MKKLSEVLRGIVFDDFPETEVRILSSKNENLERDVSKIVADSRQIEPNCVFVAVRGTQVDGHKFIATAIEKGATTIVCEDFPEHIEKNISYLQVVDSSTALAKLAANFYNNPSHHLKLIGVTGTNGKTTTTTLLYDLFTALGYKSGLISTVEYRVAGQILPSTHTTPDPVSLQWHFAEMVKAGCTYAFMEVSSHALDQNRTAGVLFSGALFSNITHDHLDYHKTFAEYIKAKQKLFDQLPRTAFALTNVDDKNGKIMVQNSRAKIYSYSLRKSSNFSVRIVENTIEGLHLLLDGHDFHARLIGEFNAYNLLACYGCAKILNMPEDEILVALSNLKGAEGRFDQINDIKSGITGIVDYAHTPDALQKVLETIQQLRKPGQRIITLTGCGGDRDPAKRHSMGKIAAEMSDIAILTSDNPRSEDPQQIINQMQAGVAAKNQRKVIENADRKQAIKTALQLAQRGDIILLAGKGHEKYQEINNIKYPFDDKEILLELLGK